MGKYKGVIILIVVGILVLVGIQLFVPSSGDKVAQKYTRESTRQTVKLSESEFIINLRHGNSFINDYFGSNWNPLPMPIKDQYKDLLKEKVVFLKEGDTFSDYKELIVFDTYTADAFPSVSAYLKHHAKELERKNPAGKIKILHDGDKGIIYQWAIIENDKTTYLEFGKVEMTDEGVLSVKYINKGTDNLENQRQAAIKLFTKV